MNSALNNSAGEYLQTAANWSLGHVPAATEPVTIPAGVTMQTQSTDAWGGTFGQENPTYQGGGDGLGNARTVATTIAGTLTLNELGGETDFDGDVTIAAGGALMVNNPASTANGCGTLVFNGALFVAGALGIDFGNLGDGCQIFCLGGVTYSSGALFENFSPLVYDLSCVIGPLSATVATTYGIRQYVDLPPKQATQAIASPWTDVSVSGNLGGILLRTTDYQGTLCGDASGGLLGIPTAFVYRNGGLWSGAINITRQPATGEWMVDFSFADGIWQLGDHGQIDIYWQVANGNPATVGSGNPEWFRASYFWLVDRLEYETYNLATQIAAASGPPVNVTTENIVISS